jgi:hypothetical protein
MMMIMVMMIMMTIRFKERELLNIRSLPNKYSNEEEIVVSVILKPIFNI